MRFVFHYLNELSPVTFTNMDVSTQLGKMEQLSVEVCTLKHAVQLQTDVGKDFRAITMEMNRRVGVLECSNLAGGDGEDEPAVSVGALGLGGGVAGEAALVGAFGSATAAGGAAPSVEGADATATDGPSGLTSLTGSPKWSHVVKGPTTNPREQC